MNEEFLNEVIAGNTKTCPHCGRVARSYRRRIHAEMVRFMTQLRRLGGRAIARDIFPGAAKASTDASYLKHWGLMRQPARGEYEVTDMGNKFLDGLLSVPEHIVMYDNKVVSQSSKTVDVLDARRVKPGAAQR